jgi:hypothetical protein
MAFKLAFNGIILLDQVARKNTNEVTWNWINRRCIKALI